MASNSLIGALQVALGIDSAQFEAGLKKAQSGLASFGRLSATAFTAAAAGAVAAGAAFAVLGKHAIDTADDLSKTAQKVGVTTEALSRLKYAADYSDVSLEQLSGGLTKLAKNMADVASGKGGTAATALDALGISITDATGKLRDTDAVFADIAEKFAHLEDGSTKTALAVQLFGKSGAELIPLLNSGRAGLKAMADESDRLGLTISTEAGRGAEELNDTFTRLQKIFDGLVTRVSTAAIPALQRLANLLTSQQFQKAAEGFGTSMVGALTDVVNWIGKLDLRWRQFLQFVATQGRPEVKPIGSTNIEDRSTPGWLERQQKAGDVLNGTFSQIDAGSTFSSPAAMFKSLSPSVPTFTDTAAAEQTASRLEALRQSLMTEEEYEQDSYAKRLEALQGFYDAGAIQKDEYDSLLEASQQQHADRMTEIAKKQIEEESRLREQLVDNVSSIFGSLSTLAENSGEENLGISKAFAVAEAVINTAQGITKALAQGGVLGFAGAAAVAAAGAAQISTILSANKGTSSSPSVGSSGASTSTAAVATPAQTGINLELKGSPEDRVSLGAVENVFNQLQEYLGTQGKELTVSYRGA